MLVIFHSRFSMKKKIFFYLLFGIKGEDFDEGKQLFLSTVLSKVHFWEDTFRNQQIKINNMKLICLWLVVLTILSVMSFVPTRGDPDPEPQYGRGGFGGGGRFGGGGFGGGGRFGGGGFGGGGRFGGGGFRGGRFGGRGGGFGGGGFGGRGYGK
ncbi:hypothetical protein Anas_10964 [Armadillidium nasatum]|uniref:Uncharacterized protein n=1 Tax=Armadillidium nasatum TaxID=96803 RepID=A0A5N5SPS9_9CRUS|nr:hypothetical protein Anas_10964 [Armadillidium nasatum]